MTPMETKLPLPDNLADLLAYHPDKLQTQVIANKDAAKIILLSLSGGKVLKTHTAPVDVLLVGLEGEAQLKVGERTILLQNGQVVQIPALVPHSLTALRNFKMLLIK